MEQTEPKPRGSYLPHRRRARGGEKPPFVFQPRDFDMLRAIYQNRFLTLDLLAAVFPPQPRTATATPPADPPKRPGTNLGKRLAGLYHHGYVDRLRMVVGGPLVYALAQRGADLLREREPALAVSARTDWAEKNRGLSAQYVDHTLMVARFRAALTVALPEANGALLRFDRESPELRTTWRSAGTRTYVDPDAFLILAEPKGRRAYFVEADRSTMTTARVLDKFARYIALYRDGVHTRAYGVEKFRVLTVAKSPERAANLLRLTIGPDSPVPPPFRAMFFFSTEDAYRADLRNVLAATWRAADEPTILRSLIASPLPRR